MFRKLGLPALVLGVFMTLFNPVAALAKHHDDDEWRERQRHERHELREQQRRYRDYYRNYYRYGYGPGFSFSYGPTYSYSPGYYSGGFYDRWGRWHPAMRGYYDAWGYWHPY